MSKIERYRQLINTPVLKMSDSEINEMHELAVSKEVQDILQKEFKNNCHSGSISFAFSPPDMQTHPDSTFIPVGAIGKQDIINAEFKAAEDLLRACRSDQKFLNSIYSASEIMIQSILLGGKLIICGNGGSMSDAMHFAAELTGKLLEDRKPLPAIAISDPAHLSCVANDYGYAQVFSRYVEAHLKPYDVLVCISTSGNSQNVIQAAQIAQLKKNKVVAITGNYGGRLVANSNVNIIVPGVHTAGAVQQVHILVIHILCNLIEKAICI
jgi:D-sedoheptulose 7-phosphate isomerase